MVQRIEFDESRVVNPALASFAMAYDQGRVAASHGRVLGQAPPVPTPALGYDQGRVVNDPRSPYDLVYDRRVAFANGRPLVSGEAVEPPIIPLVPPTELVMLGDLQANRVQAQRQDVSVHKT